MIGSAVRLRALASEVLLLIASHSGVNRNSVVILRSQKSWVPSDRMLICVHRHRQRESLKDN